MTLTAKDPGLRWDDVNLEIPRKRRHTSLVPFPIKAAGFSRFPKA